MRDFTYKICIFGDFSVGKTTLCSKYLTGIFDSGIKVTMGINIRVKEFKLKDNTIALQIWDFGGEKRFRELFPHYAKGASGGIFMYDITRRSSLLSIDEWLVDFNKWTIERKVKVPIIIVGGKLDLANNREVPVEEAKSFAASRNIDYFMECSAKTGENVEKVFDLITNIIMKKYGHI